METLRQDIRTSQSHRGGSLPDLEVWRRMNRTLEDVGAYTTFDPGMRGRRVDAGAGGLSDSGKARDEG